MKKKKFILMFVLYLIFYIQIFAFNNVNINKNYQRIEINVKKVVHLIFNEDVIVFDLGSANKNDILISVKENRIKLTGGISDFEETNLYVETKSGYIYMFIISFKKNIEQLLYFIKEENSLNYENKKIKKNELLKEKIKVEDTNKLSFFFKEYKNLFIVKNRKNKIGVVLQNILFNDSCILLKITIKNSSKIDWFYGSADFFVEKKEGNKNKKIISKKNINIIDEYIIDSKILSNKQNNYYFKISRFTLVYKENFVMTFWEDKKKGKRYINLVLNFNDFNLLIDKYQ